MKKSKRARTILKLIPRLTISKRQLAIYVVGFFVLEFVLIGVDYSMFILFDLDLVLASASERLGGVTIWLLFAMVPFYVMLEEGTFRVWTYWILKEFTKERTLFFSFLITSVVLSGILHQFNVVSGSMAARLQYFAIHVPINVYLAWIYVKGGFWTAWAAHYLWNLFLSVLGLIIYGL